MSELFTFVGVKDETGKFKNKHFNVMDQYAIDTYIKQNYGQDTYITPNEFHTPKRREENVAVCNYIVIDIDDHMSGDFTEHTAKVLIEQLSEHYNREIPTPHKVIFSGRGIHYYIAIEPETDIAKYKLVARSMVNVMDEIVGKYAMLSHVKPHVDKGVHNPNLYIRAEGTWNREAKCTAQRIDENARAIYNLDDLIENFIPDLSEIKTGGTTKASDLLNSLTYKKPYRHYIRNYTPTTWALTVMDDLRTLQAMRNGRGVHKVVEKKKRYKSLIDNEGYRYYMLWYFGTLNKLAFNSSDELYKGLYAFNRGFSDPLNENEVESTYKYLLSKTSAAPRNKTLIDMLEIAPSEQKQLKTLITKTEKNRRCNGKRSLQRQYKKNADKYALRIQINNMRATGVTAKEIASQLKISVRTVYNYAK